MFHFVERCKFHFNEWWSQAELFEDKVRNGLISISIRLADKTVKLNVLRRKCTEKAENVTKRILTLSVKRTPLIEVVHST
jgi:hypothetical protein